VHFICQEREKKEKLIPVAHLGRRWMVKFGHWEVSHGLPKWHGYRPLADACGTHASIL
jgi:hypothetical protein